MQSHEKYLTVKELRNAGLLGAPKNAGHHFKSYLKRAGKTVSGAARELGVSRSALNRFVRGDTSLSVDLGEKIQRTYDLPVEVLFKIDAEHKAYIVSQMLSQTAA